MGGFRPSPNFIPSNTQMGTLTSSNHQFTGSVDITGSLLINGVAITANGGGGGGAVSSYTNSGNNRVITSVNSNTINGEANFTFDGTDLSVSADADITSSLGKAAIGGAGLADAATFSHVDHNSATNYALRQRGSTGQTDINAANGQPISFQQNGSTKAVIDASAQFGIGNGIVPSAVLHVSSSAGTDLFKVEHADSGDNPIFVITGSNGGRIGILTDAPGAVLDIHPQNSAGNNEVKIRGSAAVSHFYTTTGEDTFIRGGTQSSHVVLADVRNTTGTNNQKLSIGDAGNATTAKMHLSSSDTPTVMAVTSDSGSILTALENQRVGIGVTDPDSTLEVLSTTTQQKWSYDSDSFATLTVADDGHTTLASSTETANSGNITLDAHGDLYFQADSGQIYLQKPGGSNKLVFDIEGGPAYMTLQQNADMIFRVGASQNEIFRLDQSEDSLLMNTDSEVQFRDSETGIHSPSANILEVNSKASGSTQFIVSGAFGNTDFETRSVNFSILSPSGTSLIDTTSLANNTTYTYSIENGAFVGQQKKIFGKVTYVYGQTTNSNALIVTGSNIEGSNFGLRRSMLLEQLGRVRWYVAGVGWFKVALRRHQ